MKSLTFLFAWLLVACVSQARIITVDDDGPADFHTIQAAIDAAAWGDTVLAAQGTYNENINVKGKNITLTSTEPNDPDVVAATVIHGDGAASVVTFSGTEESMCKLCGFTIKGGCAIEPAHGGGIQGNGTSARITNCHITENMAYRKGGGLFDCDGSITNCRVTHNSLTSLATTEGAGLNSCDGPITNCTIAHNTSAGGMYGSGVGGALYNCHGPITNCTITSNLSGGNGGGLYDCDGPISNCTIADNKAKHDMIQSRGAGLYRCDGPIANCAISNNLAWESGGGIYGCNGSIRNSTINGNKAHAFYAGGLARCKSIITCIISGNSSDRDAGGLSECDSIHNCIISNNVAAGNGAGVHNCGELINCTIASNRTNGNGGGIYCQGSTTVSNCILWGNSASKGDEISLDTYVVCGIVSCFELPSTMTVGYTNIQGRATRVYLKTDCNVQWELGNIDADPGFADTAYWDPNGTPEDANDDDWVDGDYHLKSEAGRWDPNTRQGVPDEVTSPCIDAADPMSPIGREPFPNGGIVNMGAYGGTAEASKSYFGELPCETIIAGDINGDCRIDYLDFALMSFHWLQDNSR